MTLPEDENTSDVMARLETVTNALARVDATEGASFFVLRKRPEAPWEHLSESWPLPPPVNPTRIDPDTGIAMWTLGDQTAVVLLTGTTEATFESVFGAANLGRHDWAVHADGYAIARCRMPHDGTRVTQLMRAALSRVSARALEQATV